VCRLPKVAATTSRSSTRQLPFSKNIATSRLTLVVRKEPQHCRLWHAWSDPRSDTTHEEENRSVKENTPNR